ncbi:MAG TPA: hypothetical protein VFO39_09715 [Candidatus Sulfotelmatobacter sp.]|nr:hypothetical protein [Candidatus Sulfotelmatobacter sp.]
MKRKLFSLTLTVCLSLFAAAQQNTSAVDSASSTVPKLITYSGMLKNSGGQTVTAITGVTFLLYKDAQGGPALWLETQNVTPDRSGHFSVQLGATTAHGLPADLFQNGEARWLALQIGNEAEQPRVMLVAVPYAIKAADAETVGGLPPSAFVLATAPNPNTSADAGNASAPVAIGTASVTGTGTLNFIPIFTGASTLGNSALFQTGGKVGINTLTPGATLDVKGGATVRGPFLLPSTGTATATKGSTSQGQQMVASAFNSSSKTAVNQNFRWLAEPASNNTAAPSATLNLQFSSGGATPAETGLKIDNKGRIAFAAGQAFPGTGTITAVTAGTDLTGGGNSGSVTLNLDTTKVPQLNTPNTFTQLQTINNQVLVQTTIGGQALIAFGKGGPNGIQGTTDSTGGVGVAGTATATTGNAVGVIGSSNAPTGSGGSFTGANGVVAQAFICCAGVGGEFVGASAPSGSSSSATIGVLGLGGNAGLAVASDGVGGEFQGGNKGLSGDGVVGIAGSGFAGNFSGNLNVSGTITAGTKDFKIDHPLDPANKYLVHASVESSEMKNIYDGNITTNDQGDAIVQLPDWFEALNADFRYQLTVIGQFAQAIVSREIQDHQFQIKTNLPNVKVSWQVTGVRRDAFAKAHPLVVEEAKESRLRGFYIHPELYGAPQAKQIEWARHPEMMHQREQIRDAQVPAAATPRQENVTVGPLHTGSTPK